MEVDLTLESDSEPEIMIVDAPSTRRAKVPALKPPVLKPPAPTPPTSKLPGSDTAHSNPLQAPHDEIDLISPEQTPPREIEDNPLQYLPTPELQVPPTPELRYPSERSVDPIQSRSHSLVPGFGAMRLGARTPNTHPAFPIVEPTPFTHRLGPPNPPCQSQPQLLPPVLRPSQGSIIGEHLLKATSESRAVRIIGVPELEANGWIFEEREQEVEFQPVTKNKGKGRALGERTRDWTPLVQREERARVAEREHASGQPPAAQKRSVFCLIPPPKETPKTAWTPALYPSRQPRKRAAIKKGPAVPTVKVEDTSFYLAS
ncbi:hypothetical protein FRC12_012737 [Ceratobasidium sp. 428]|nr:hypothetical protein FRC12_012737 [Ceratobasidium sp. 428]